MIVGRRAALGLIGASALAACTKGGDAGVLKVGSQRGGTKSMMEASGMLAGLPFAIEWAEFPAAQHLIEALGAGAVDLGGVGDAPFLFAYEGGSPIRSVQATRYDPRNPATTVLVPRTSTVRDMAGLRGRKIATGRGSAGHFLLLRALERARIPASAVSIVFLPPGDAKGAFSSGAVDAWSTWNPYAGAAILHDGARVIAEGRGLTTGYGFTAAHAPSIDAKRPLIAAFLERNQRAQRWASNNLDAFAPVLQRETGLPADVARYFANRGLTAVPTNAALIADMRGVLETFRRAGAADMTRPIDAAFDTSFDGGLQRPA